jgi:endoglucanase
MWNEQNQMEPEAFELLNSALDWCHESGLRVIVDLHILRSHHFNEKEKPLWTDSTAQNRFLDCWRDLSSQLKKWPNGMVAYELMNEPVADDPEDWNKLVTKAVKKVRELEPERVLVIGSNRWQSVDTFDQLQVPQNDPNILLSFHFYTPFLLTHHRASWTGIRDYEGPVHYPGWSITEAELKDVPDSLKAQLAMHNQDFNREVLLQLIEKPLRIAQKYDLPLYCGEWGCYALAPLPDSWRWYEDMRSIFEEKGIGWATWDYKGGFGLYDREGKPITELIQILLPK